MALLIGRGERSAPGLRLLSRPRFWPSRRRSGLACWWVWMVVRFVVVIRVPLCAPACPVCVPCVTRLPPVSFYRLRPDCSKVLKPLSMFVKFRTS